jgi:hypothetical protein
VRTTWGWRVDLFLWVLQGGGVSIALVGMGRERWLRARRRAMAPQGGAAGWGR